LRVFLIAWSKGVFAGVLPKTTFLMWFFDGEVVVDCW
jgi:hypothetical protein